MGDVVACVSSVLASCSCVGDVLVCATSPPDTRSAELEAEEEPEHPRAAHRHSVRMPVNTVRATLPPVRPFTLTACPSIRCAKDCDATLTSPPEVKVVWVEQPRHYTYYSAVSINIYVSP